MAQFVAESKKLPSCAKLDIRGSHSWEEVKIAIAKAQEEYDRKGKEGFSGKLRGLGRRSVAKSSMILSPSVDDSSCGWLALLPAGEYSSIICGSLKLVFGVSLIHSYSVQNLTSRKAAQNHTKLRESILNALSQFPQELDAVDFYLRLYEKKRIQDDLHDRLVQAAFRLYISVLKAIECLMDWLDHNVFGKTSMYVT